MTGGSDMRLRTLTAGALALVLAACGSTPRRDEVPRPAAKPPAEAGPAGDAQRAEGERKTAKPGGYYLDDGPLEVDPALLDRVPDAVPRAEPIKASTMRPYSALGRTYTPMTALAPYKVTGVASWYGKRYHGQPTASGEVYDMFAMTAAHPTLPIPSYVRVTQVDNGRSVVVRVNDRGPFHADRVIDLSYTAAYRLGLMPRGQGVVRVESLMPPFAGKAVAARPVAPPASASATRRATAQASAPTATPAESSASTATAAQTSAPNVNPALSPASTGTPVQSSARVAPARGAYLQLGAFTQRENAQAFLTRIGAELDWLAPRTSLRDEGSLIRVQAGPFDSDQEASQAAARVKAVMDFQPMIVVR